MTHPADNCSDLSRRLFLRRGAFGFGALGFLQAAGALRAAAAPAPRGVLKEFHVPPRAKRVIFLFMGGGPSQFETFDPKPKLNKLWGQPMPESLTKGERVAQLQGAPLVILGTHRKFAKSGRAGVEVSDLLPQMRKVMDEFTVIRSMQTYANNHDPGVTFMQTGHQLPGRPAMGAWLSYGLGSESANLPAYMVLLSGQGQDQNVKARYWTSGFLPTIHQGVQLRSPGEPVFYLDNPTGMNSAVRRRILDSVRELNQARLDTVGDPEIATRIAQYELAYRMQTSVPELTDLAREPKSVFDLYGDDARKPGTFAANCLLARRLAERGVRFIQLYHRGWDHHDGIQGRMIQECKKIDQPCAGLLRDLKQRGLLKDTLVVWSGEFGRTPMAQGDAKSESYGRDHQMRAFTSWVAGGGFKAGAVHGATDEFGYTVTENPVHVHDLHATMLHALGIDHLRLTFKFQAREHRLTDIAGKVVSGLLA
ncbi:MAG: DUF1501 domain-containing protein [Limisphaerales bacterium]